MDHGARVLAITDESNVAAELEQMGVSSAGVRIMAPKGVFRAVKLYDVPLRAAVIIKQEMLAKGGEAALPYEAASLAADKCDVMLMGTVRQFRLTIETLKEQPFGLNSVASQIEVALSGYDGTPEPITCGGRTFHFGQRTYIMGILNVTPDSFSDGGQHFTTDAAVKHGIAMLEAGADIIDIGGESTRPGSDPVSCEEEIARVVPVAERLVRETGAVISIDTYKAEVAERCLDLGAHIINDITALAGEGDMASVVSRYKAPVILMHMKGKPKDMQEFPEYDCVVRDVYDHLKQRIDYACSRGIPSGNIIVDPGIGFGKTPAHNLEILRRLAEFRSLGRPILVGTSRKSTIGKVTNASGAERVWGTAATCALAVSSGADFVRVHDVREMALAVRMSDAIIRGWPKEGDGNAF